MKRQTFSLLFIVRKGKARKNGELPIFARITVNGERTEFGIAQTVAAENWDFERGCAIGNTKAAKNLQGRLDMVKSRIMENLYELEKFKEVVTATRLRNSFLGINNDSRTILEEFEEHNEKCRGLKNIDFSPATVQRYETTKKHVATFIKLRYKKNDMNLNEINYAFVKDLEYYLKVERKCNNNSAVKYMKNFKKIVRIALANGRMRNDPFANVTYRLDEVDLDYLNEQELDALIEKQFEIERLQMVKDAYLFCCFTGLAFIDVKNLKRNEVHLENGHYWIKKKRQKTDNWCHVPMLEPAVAIMNKYEKHPACVATNLVLPVLSNQKMNAYLKEIADLTGINKNLSTHTARHTFATTVTLANHISMEVVSKMLGHSSLNMTRKYARVVDELINKDMSKIYDKFSYKVVK